MKNMMKFSLALLISAAAFCVNAEKIVATHTVNATAVSGYAVDDKGNIITFTNSISDAGLLVLTTYEYSHGKDFATTWTGTFPIEDIPDGTTNFEITGLSRKTVLVRYTDGVDITYATYTIKKNQMKLKETFVASTGETMTLSKQKIISNITNGGVTVLQQYTLKFKASKTKKVTGTGTVYVLNPPLQKHYVDEAGVGILTIRVIKP